MSHRYSFPNCFPTTLLAAALLAILFINSFVAVSSTRAQFTSTVTSQQHDQSFSAGRDFWIAEMSNNWGTVDTDTYMRLYVTSPQNTVAHIAFGSKTDTLQIVAYTVSSFLLPESVQMESSGIVENKAIHIWCTDAPLIVYNMNHVAYSTDGEYLIPSSGWGTDYVVAAYASNFDASGDDEPSEMAIVADEDTTTVTITPACDCRSTEVVNGVTTPPTVVVYPQGQSFSITMNRGQSFQLMPVKATAVDGFDLTGTIVHANHNIGVLGGSMDANIPNDFAYPDHVEDMLPPVRNWGTMYAGTSFTEPPGTSNHDWAYYLLIGSQPGQTIFVHSCEQGDRVAAVISNQYGFDWDAEEAGEKYYSSAPFLCVEYVPSASYPDNNNGNGDPAEAHLNPIVPATRTILFETPTTGDVFTNYANIIINNADIDRTLYDGKPTSAIPHQCIDANWSICVINNIAAGAHLISGDDSGVGVNVYGYGFDQTYEWSSEAFMGTFQSPDIAAPVAQISSECADATVTFTDTGASASEIAAIWIDSSANTTFDLDTAWHEGIPVMSDFFSSSVIDRSEPAALRVTAYDFAGNSTTVTLNYKPILDSIQPPLRNLGVWIAGSPSPNVAFDTIFNIGTTTDTITLLALKYGDVGFSIFDSVGGPVDLSPMKPGQHRLVMIKFQAIKPTLAVDSILFGDACQEQSVAIIGSGGGAGFIVSNQSWIGEQLPAPADGYEKTVTITNLSTVPITIDSAWWADTAHFKVAMINGIIGDTVPGDSFPISLTPQGTAGGTHQFLISYYPDDSSGTAPNITHGNWTSPQVLVNGISGPEVIVTDSLYGSAIPEVNDVAETNTSDQILLTSLDGRTVHAILPSTWIAPIHIELLNTLGQVVYDGSIPGTTTFDPGPLPRGVYFWRISANSLTQNGKILLGE